MTKYQAVCSTGIWEKNLSVKSTTEDYSAVQIKGNRKVIPDYPEQTV
jgi:hypothetical protein